MIVLHLLRLCTRFANSSMCSTSAFPEQKGNECLTNRSLGMTEAKIPVERHLTSVYDYSEALCNFLSPSVCFQLCASISILYIDGCMPECISK